MTIHHPCQQLLPLYLPMTQHPKKSLPLGPMPWRAPNLVLVPKQGELTLVRLVPQSLGVKRAASLPKAELAAD
jgi:hypothetical protein